MDTYLDTYLKHLLCLITDEIALDISYENSRMRTIWEHNYLKRFSIFKAFNLTTFIISLLELFNFVYSI